MNIVSDDGSYQEVLRAGIPTDNKLFQAAAVF